MKRQPKGNLNRKSFLRLIGGFFGTAAVNFLLQSCSQTGLIQSTPEISTPTATKSQVQNTPTSTPTKTPAEPTKTPPSTSTFFPEPTSTSSTSRVALIKTDNRLEGIQQAIDLLGINPIANKDILLKPNFNSADPSPGSTHLDTLRSLVRKLQEMGAGNITVGDRSGMGNTQTVMKTLGVLDLAKEMGFETINFDELRFDEWEHIKPKSSNWQQGFLIARPCLECGALVQTCNLKTHRYGGVFTLSLKNSVGMVAKRHPTNGYQYMTELHNSPNQRKMIAEINTAYNPALIVMDGVQAFTSGGPDKGSLASPGVILAGTDRVALDVIGVAILQISGASFNGSIFEQEQISRAIELNLGISSPEQIEILTTDQASTDFGEQILAELTKK